MYSTWARFYDEVYVDQHDSAALAFSLEEAKGAGGPVLEAGCGTGRLLNVFHPSYRFTVAQQGQWQLEDEFVHRATNRHTRYCCAVENDLVNQIKTVRGRFEELDEKGKLAAVTESEFRLTWIFKPQ